MDIKNDDQFEDDDFSGFNSGDIDSDFLADEYAPKDANNETIEPIQKVERNEQNKSLLNFGSTLQIGDESPLSAFPQAQQSQNTTKNDAKINNTPIDLKSFLQTPVGSIADLDDKSNVTGSRLLIKKTMDKAQDKPKPKVNIFPIPLNDSSSLHFESSSQLQISSKDNNNSSNNSNLINNSTKTSQFTLPGIPVLTNDQNNLPPLSDKNNINLKPQSNIKTIRVSASNTANNTIPSDNQISANNHDASKANEEVKNANITIPSQNKTESSTIKVSIKPRFAVNQKLQQQTNLQQIHPIQQQQTMQQNQSSVKQIQDQPSQQQSTSNQQDQQKHVQVVHQPLQNQQTVQQTPSQHQIQNLQQQQLQNQQIQNHQPQQKAQQQVPNQNNLQNHDQPQQQKIKSQQMADPQSQQQIQETPKQQEKPVSQPQQIQSQQISSQKLQNQQHQINPPQQQNLQHPQQSQIQPQPLQFQAQPQQPQQQQQQQQQQQPAFASPPYNNVTQAQQHQLQPQPAFSTPPLVGLTQMQSQSSSVTHAGFVPQSSQQPPQPQIQLHPQPQSQPVPLLLQPNPIIYGFSTSPPSVPLASQYNQSTERVHLSFSAALDSSLATVRRSVATELTTALRNSSASRLASSFSSHSFTLDVDDFLSGLTSELVSAISFTSPADTSSSSQPPLLPPSTSLYTPLNQFLGGNFNSADFDYSNGFSSVNVNIGSAMPARVASTASTALFNNGNQTSQKEPILMRQLVRGIGAAIDNETRPLSAMMKNAMQEKNRAKMENVTILQNLLNDVESMRMACKNFSDEIIRELEREELMVSSRKEAAISESNKKASQLREMKLQSIEFESKKSQQEIELKKNSELFDRLKQQKINFMAKSSGKFSLNNQSGRVRRNMQNRFNNSVNDYEFEQVLDEINEIENEIENGGYGQICGEFESLLKYFQNDTNSMRDEIINEDYFNQQLLSMPKLNSRYNNSYYSQNRMQVPSQQNQNFNSNLNSYANNNMSMCKQSQGNLVSGKNHSNFQNKVADTNKRIGTYRNQRDALMQSNLT